MSDFSRPLRARDAWKRVTVMIAILGCPAACGDSTEGGSPGPAAPDASQGGAGGASGGRDGDGGSRAGSSSGGDGAAAGQGGSGGRAEGGAPAAGAGGSPGGAGGGGGDATGGASGDSDAGSIVDAGSRDAGFCQRSLANTASNATCSAFTSEPTATGGVVPEGIYHLVTVETDVCIVQSQTIAVRRLSAGLYEGESVADTGTEVWNISEIATSGTVMAITHLCSSAAPHDWSYSVQTEASVTALIMSDSASVFVYELVSSLADGGA